MHCMHGIRSKHCDGVFHVCFQVTSLREWFVVLRPIIPCHSWSYVVTKTIASPQKVIMNVWLDTGSQKNKTESKSQKKPQEQCWIKTKRVVFCDGTLHRFFLSFGFFVPTTRSLWIYVFLKITIAIHVFHFTLRARVRSFEWGLFKSSKHDCAWPC